MSNSYWNSLLLLALLGTIAHLALVLQRAPSDARWVGAERGNELRIELQGAQGEYEAALTDLADGKCLYVMIGSTGCGASRESAERWARYERATQLSDELPGWRFLWLVDHESTDQPSFPPTASPVYYRMAAPFVRQSAALRAYPSHLVLNRDGRFVEGDVGIRLPAADDFQEDCTLKGVPG